MLYRIICTEEVATELTVDAPDQQSVLSWLENNGASAVAEMTDRQTIQDRRWDVERWTYKFRPPVDLQIKQEPEPEPEEQEQEGGPR